jgi:surface carbohydrate biosynthesis protein
MAATKPTILIPVENQVRELDPKLLLACIAARRGFSSVIGSRRELELRVASFPRSVYLSKSMTVRSLLIFYLARKLGHDVVTWDEEALVHLPPEMYFSRRLSSAAMRHVSHLFAWGEDNAELWRRYPALPNGTPIHVTGNPRGDLLRPELLSFYAREVEEIRSRCGEFILVNTNFNHVNAFYPGLNLFKPVKAPGRRPEFGRAARGMTRAYAEGLRDHKQSIFDHFQRLIPDLEQAFPNYTIVVRPHPTESQEPYRRIAAGRERVHVTNDGNVVPWLLTTRALVHNGCTTGVEAYVLRVPAISYRATVNDDYDCGFYRLPNLLSYQCFSFEEVCSTLRRILAGDLGAANGDKRQALALRHLAAQDGPFACERIVDVIEAITPGPAETLRPGLGERLSRWCIGRGLDLARWIMSRFQAGHLNPEFQRHRYPGIPLEKVRARLSRFQKVLGDRSELNVEQVTDVIFRISP